MDPDRPHLDHYSTVLQHPPARCGIGSTHHTHRCERPAGHAGVHVGRGCSWGEDAVETLGPATSADLLELDAVPEPIDSAAPAATYPPGCAPVGPDAATRPIRRPDIHARTLARARP